jgi:hypothetical protein
MIRAGFRVNYRRPRHKVIQFGRANFRGTKLKGNYIWGYTNKKRFNTAVLADGLFYL